MTPFSHRGKRSPLNAAASSYPDQNHQTQASSHSTDLHRNAAGAGESPILIRKVGLVSTGRPVESVLRFPPACLQEFLLICARDANLVKNNSTAPSTSVQQTHAESSRGRDLHQTDDDDAFVEPPLWRPVAKKQCIDASVAANATTKAAKIPVKYAHAPTARCAPSTLNSFVDHLTFEQRRRINGMGFGGLLRVSADRIDPTNMVINVTKDKAIHVTPFAVKQVLGLPDSGEDLHFHTHNQASKALSAFKTLVGLEQSQDLHASHLQKILEDDFEMGSAMIGDDMAIRFFFIIACNKLLCSSTDNNIRCRDVYLTSDLFCLSGLNWCKAVVDDLRDATVSWQVDKTKKSLSEFAILLIILYLDNLQCKYQIAHTDTPRAKYFDQNLRISTSTCYHETQHPSSNVPPSIELLVATHFPSMQVELHGLVAQIGCRSRKTQAILALANFDAKAWKALCYMNMGHQMLQDARQAAIRTLRTILYDEVHGNNTEDYHDHPPACDAAQATDVDMYDVNSVHNVGSENVFVPIIRSATVENDMPYGGHTNQRLNQGVHVELQQKNIQDQALPASDTLRSAVNDSFTYPNDNVEMDKEIEGALSPICSQVHTDVTIDHVVPPFAAKGDIGPSSPIGEFSGSEILESFLDGEMLSSKFISYFVACMSHDECHMADGGGYRIFLSQELGEYINIEEDEDFSQWESPQALAILQRDIGDVDPTKVKLSHDNDSRFYAIKFMELWNGDSLHVPILAENIRQYRSQLLFYGLYHTTNDINKLPAGLEAHRPHQ
ncbi:hypothetical protein C2845_PM10G10430 [Panicum miliaceum]|uniref:Ubiquitin-like protease family profile domain-containing protein n=1 Tax=Panicum miliaceum TaxID=4540 RepID=A0A3L6PDT3_PANMI|nr:hypothetical protein C2845_PM10G10430 [Panicum miliaceum]